MNKKASETNSAAFVMNVSGIPFLNWSNMNGFPPAEILAFGLMMMDLVAPEQLMSTFALTFGKIASMTGSMTTG